LDIYTYIKYKKYINKIYILNYILTRQLKLIRIIWTAKG